MLLRTDMGLPLSFLSADSDAFLHNLQEEGLAKQENDRLILSDKGRLLVDEIAVQFIH